MLSSSMDMLEESLIKKIDIMTEIEIENEKQKEILSDPENVDEEAFDATVDKKGRISVKKGTSGKTVTIYVVSADGQQNLSINLVL